MEKAFVFFILQASMFKALKRKIGYYHIWKNRRHQRRKRQVFNLKTARDIGILFDATNQENFDIIHDFYQNLKKNNIQVRVLGFINEKDVPGYYLFKTDFIFFSRKTMNWLNIPVRDEVVKFIKYPFDILIDLTMNDHFIFDYITGSSPARFKVGRYRKKHVFPDMMIKLDDSLNLEDFVELVTNYLETINRPELSPNFLNI